MQKLSMREFKNFCDEMPQSHFLFDSINQDWFKIDESMKIKQSFDNIKINFNPNTIHLYSSLGELTFERVKYIEMDKTSMLGTIFTIICGNSFTNCVKRSYKIIADKTIQ